MKSGILHDYDLMANREPSARGNVCVTCGADPIVYQWSDYSGEGMCTRCGTPYQLKWGSDEQVKGAAYPYLNLKTEWVAVVRRYHEETGKWTYLGTGFNQPGRQEFHEWVEANDAAPESNEAAS